MLPDYSDITSRIADKPLWWDNGGVPRYEPFVVDMCSVYIRWVALVRIACQSCSTEFVVAQEIERVGAGLIEPVLPDIAKGNIGHFHYGDPPRHDCTGDTMNVYSLEVLQLWQRSNLQWVRLQPYEGVLANDSVDE